MSRWVLLHAGTVDLLVAAVSQAASEELSAPVSVEVSVVAPLAVSVAGLEQL